MVYKKNLFYVPIFKNDYPQGFHNKIGFPQIHKALTPLGIGTKL